METALHCNNLRCRAVCADRALVTTCSHIFCEPCASTLRLLAEPTAPGTHREGRHRGAVHQTRQDLQHRKCPACNSALTKVDDAVLTTLSPSEDYKTCVLSGLPPGVIMECAGRGLAFWSYQVAQEIIYQEYLARSLTEKYQGLDGHLDKVIAEATKEIHSLQGQIDSLSRDFAAVEARNQKLTEAYREKSKSHQQLHRLYQALKQQQLAAGVEKAAQYDADNAVLGDRVSRPHRSPDVLEGQTLGQYPQHQPRIANAQLLQCEGTLVDNLPLSGFARVGGRDSLLRNTGTSHRWPMDPPPIPTHRNTHLSTDTGHRTFMPPSQSLTPAPRQHIIPGAGYVTNTSPGNRYVALDARAAVRGQSSHPATLFDTACSGASGDSGGASYIRAQVAIPQYGLTGGVRLGRSQASLG